MNIHEFQAKALLSQFGVPICKGKVASTPEEAEKAFAELKVSQCAIKAQIHAGGRGKAGGVKIIQSALEARAFAENILGHSLVTHQTTPQGQKVQYVYVEAGCDIKQEIYLSLLIDSTKGWPTFVFSLEGGMDIEEVAKHTPEKIFKVAIDPATGFQNYHAHQIAFALNLIDKEILGLQNFLKSVYKAFIELDASLIEINPLVLTKSNNFLALDAKMSFDDNSLFRHPEVVLLRDEAEEDPMELEASRHQLSYIKLEGNIGCMVNGAGLAMATMDAIKLYGGEPANFLDVGGGATKQRVTEAFKLIMSDKSVQGILINIFGGIMRCDIIAEGVIAAAKEISLKVPLVIRLEGTNVEQGKSIIQKSDLKVIAADDLGDAARRVVDAVRGCI